MKLLKVLNKGGQNEKISVNIMNFGEFDKCDFCRNERQRVESK